MDNKMTGQAIPWMAILKGGIALVVLGLGVYIFEHWGDQSMSRLSSFVAGQGEIGVLIFISVNALATMFMVPQSFFTVAAGALFGWKFGTIWASAGMSIGAIGAFYLARYGVRDQIREKFRLNVVFKRMQRLSRSHPLHVISASRLIPVIPFPLASYLLGVTEVRSLPYALLTWLCMLPETLFLASGGHLLHTGITRGHGSTEAAVVLCVAVVVLAVVVHRIKKNFLEKVDED